MLMGKANHSLYCNSIILVNPAVMLQKVDMCPLN